MDFRFGPEEEAFRQEVRGFLKQELPDDWFERNMDFEEEDGVAFARKFRKKLSDKGWLTMAWPKEYGGQAASHIKQLVFNEETAYWGVPAIDNGISMLGPILMMYGTERQKAYYLSGISKAQWVWAQGYSEPGAGSDLASLQTRAVEDGDDFVVSGSKIWNGAHGDADKMFLMARTNPDAPKHRGISFLLLDDMRMPGVTVTKIPRMWGRYRALVYLYNVRIPKANLVGEKDRGWYVGAALLDFERSGVGWVTRSRRVLDELVTFARETVVDGEPLGKKPLVRHALAEMAVETEALRLICYQVAWMQGHGQVPNKEASATKLFGTEIGHKMYDVGLQLLGMYGGLEPDSKWAPLRGRIENGWLTTFGHKIMGGSSEIQRNVIATRGLGLPRE
ncbi:MAG: acyl-CoA dehydrogenase family protein [Chloroflexi bacterium]|nr:acyl-CoA dehydrogenase family protein [Chloroflexota bacterium]